MAGRITKVKQVDGRLLIHQVEGEGTLCEREITIKSGEDPHPDLMAAFRALEEHARDILEWPVSYAKGRIRITGVSYSFSESTEVEGAVITGLVELETSDAPFSFNTPHLAYAQYSETGNAKLMPEEAQEALGELRLEAAKFIKGKRLQGDLFPLEDDTREQQRQRVAVRVGEVAAAHGTSGDAVTEVVDEIIATAAKPPKTTKAGRVKAAADRAEARAGGKMAAAEQRSEPR